MRWLCDSIIEGFDTGIHRPPEQTFKCKNLRSASENSDFVTQAIAEEVTNDFVIGPFDNVIWENSRISPIGVAKGKWSGKLRLILDLSSPHDNEKHPSINSLIEKDSFSLSYTTIDDAVSVITKLGVNSTMCKVDVASAFKILPIKPSQWRYYGFQWQNKIYYFQKLAFGCRSSPFLFTQLSKAISWIATHKYGIQHILYLLDDFLTIDPPGSDSKATMSMLCKLFSDLSIPLNTDKTMGPSRKMVYLGIELCSESMSIALPRDKLIRTRELLQHFINRPKCTKRELLQLLGHLVYGARVISPCRAFLNKLFTAANSVKKLWHRVHLSKDTKSDIRMWLKLMNQWSGISMFLDSDITRNEDLHAFTDSSSSFGCGGFYESAQEYFTMSWECVGVDPHDMKNSMAFLEFIPIIYACYVWGHLWSGKRLIWHCDNEALCHIINKSRTRIDNIMELVYILVFLSLKYSFTFHALWLPSASNDWADALSRNDLRYFQRQAPHFKCIKLPNLQHLINNSKSKQPISELQP